MLRTFVCLLAATGIAHASPIGSYSFEPDCDPLVPYDAVVKSDFIVLEHGVAGCKVNGPWRKLRDGWSAYVSECSVIDPDDGNPSPNWYTVTITPLPSGAHLFDLNIGGGGYWTAYKCEADE